MNEIPSSLPGSLLAGRPEDADAELRHNRPGRCRGPAKRRMRIITPDDTAEKLLTDSAGSATMTAEKELTAEEGEAHVL